MEPLPCLRPFSTEAGGCHYLWRGRGPGQEATSIGIYIPENEQWLLQPTTGCPPSGMSSGGCVSLGGYLYCYGGFNTVTNSMSSDLHKLNLKTFEWSEIYPRNHSLETPMNKDGCRLVAVNERTLMCFGGWGIGPIQAGSKFSRDVRYLNPYGWTNELHCFDELEGNNHHLLYYTSIATK